MARTTIHVQPEILRWARDRRGYDLETAAKRVDVKPERLAALEDGSDRPSVSEVHRMADKYRVSSAVFFMPAPPDIGFEAPRDFRTLPADEEGQFSPELRKEIDRVRGQIRILRELRDLGTAVPRPVSLSLPHGTDPEDASVIIRSWLDRPPIDLAVKPDPLKVLQDWIHSIEDQGILVGQVSRIRVSEMRGFCLPDPEFPMIVLNGGDSEGGRLFTLIHELTHLLLGEDSVCNDPTAVDSHEAYCNSVSAATLIPRESILELDRVRAAGPKNEWSLDELEEMARPYGVSREATLRRLLTLGKTSVEYYRQVRAYLLEHYRKASEADPGKKKKSGGPPQDVMILRNLGRPYVESVLAARDRGLISEVTVANYIFAKLRWADALAVRIGGPAA